MKLNLSRPIVFFDLETTGVNVSTDRIVEISLIKVFPNGNEETKTMRINPEMHIPEEASAITGITDEDVKDCPTFKEVAADVAKMLEGADLGGFNSNKFDIPMLAEEFIRAGLDVDLYSPLKVDVQNIYHKLERRTLVAAYRFYCDKDLNNAHSANADTRATYEVLMAQLDKYPELENNVEKLAEFSRMNSNVDFAGRFVYDENGVEVFNFGKYKGRAVVEVLKRDPGYYNWMMQGDFALNTKRVLTQIRDRANTLNG